MRAVPSDPRKRPKKPATELPSRGKNTISRYMTIECILWKLKIRQSFFRPVIEKGSPLGGRLKTWARKFFSRHSLAIIIVSNKWIGGEEHEEMTTTMFRSNTEGRPPYQQRRSRHITIGSFFTRNGDGGIPRGASPVYRRRWKEMQNFGRRRKGKADQRIDEGGGWTVRIPVSKLSYELGDQNPSKRLQSRGLTPYLVIPTSFLPAWTWYRQFWE